MIPDRPPFSFPSLLPMCAVAAVAAGAVWALRQIRQARSDAAPSAPNHLKCTVRVEGPAGASAPMALPRSARLEQVAELLPYVLDDA